jgi:hypothetical protein
MVDLLETLADREFSTTFTVNRRTETVSISGRSTIATATNTGVDGSVTPSSPRDLQRLPEEQRMRKSLTIITAFALQGPSPGTQADVVIWPESNGNQYVVADVEDWGQFGFISAIVQIMDLVPNAPQVI